MEAIRGKEAIIKNTYDAMIVASVSLDHANGRSISASALHNSRRRDSSMNLSHSLDLALAPRPRRGGLRKNRGGNKDYDRQHPKSRHSRPPVQHSLVDKYATCPVAGIEILRYRIWLTAGRETGTEITPRHDPRGGVHPKRPRFGEASFFGFQTDPLTH